MGLIGVLLVRIRYGVQRTFDISEMLQDDATIAEYLTLVLEDGAPVL